MTEQQQYVVVEAHDGFELRRYPEHVVAEVTVSGDFDEAGNRAFRPLFRYISGNNRSSRSLAMTAPVVQEAAARAQDAASEKVSMTAPVVQTEAGDGAFLVAFVLPADLTEETAPVPADPNVRIAHRSSQPGVASITACPTATIGDAWGSTNAAATCATPIATAAVTSPSTTPDERGASTLASIGPMLGRGGLRAAYGLAFRPSAGRRASSRSARRNRSRAPASSPRDSATRASAPLRTL